jgi:hypothetical protein
MGIKDHSLLPPLRRFLRYVVAPFWCAMMIAVFAALPSFAQQANAPTPNPDCGGPSLTGAPTNAGTQFMLCFEQNSAPDPIVTGDHSYLDIYMASLGDLDTVTITCRRYPLLNKVFVIQPNGSQIYRITNEVLQEPLNVLDTLRDLWITSHEIADDRVVQVNSTNAIVCNGMNYKLETADAFLALPLQSAGTEYRTMCYPNSTFPLPSQFAVAAYVDNTTVTIIPAASTSGGHPGGAPFQVTLMAGQCVQIQADSVLFRNDSPPVLLDLTGSVVRADHPVAVFSGHARTEAPFPEQSSRDLLLEEMPPTSAWGNAFVLDALSVDSKATKQPGGDVMRILALDSNTVVTVNGQPWVTLNANEHVDSMIKSPLLVESSPNHPILIGEIAHSATSASGGMGDPFLAIVPPVTQTYNKYTFFSAPDTDFHYEWVIIAADTSCQSSITVDGRAIPSFFFTPVPGNTGGRSFAIYEDLLQTSGAHTISTSKTAEEGFSILSYGFGPVVSYGYAGGELLVPKRSIRIEPPPEAMGTVHTNALDFHNTAYQPAYVDSAVFVPDNPKEAAFGIHPLEDVGLEIGRVDIGGSGEFHLTSDVPLTWPISGTVKMYSHLPSYFLIEPAERHFTLYPNAVASVEQGSKLTLSVTASPNPFSVYTTIHFSIPETGDITMTLYDGVGKVARHITSSEFSAGPYSVRIDRRDLASGTYFCEIVSQKLNIHERVPIVVGE